VGTDQPQPTPTEDQAATGDEFVLQDLSDQGQADAAGEPDQLQRVEDEGEDTQEFDPFPVVEGEDDRADEPAEPTDAGEEYVPTTIAGVDRSLPYAVQQAQVDEVARQAMLGVANPNPIPPADREADCICETLEDGSRAGDFRCPVHGQLLAARLEAMASRDTRLSPLRDYLPKLDGVMWRVPDDDPVYATA
jgi:hypothetical protein